MADKARFGSDEEIAKQQHFLLARLIDPTDWPEQPGPFNLQVLCTMVITAQTSETGGTTLGTYLLWYVHTRSHWLPWGFCERIAHGKQTIYYLSTPALSMG